MIVPREFFKLSAAVRIFSLTHPSQEVGWLEKFEIYVFCEKMKNDDCIMPCSRRPIAATTKIRKKALGISPGYMQPLEFFPQVIPVRRQACSKIVQKLHNFATLCVIFTHFSNLKNDKNTTIVFPVIFYTRKCKKIKIHLPSSPNLNLNLLT